MKIINSTIVRDRITHVFAGQGPGTAIFNHDEYKDDCSLEA